MKYKDGTIGCMDVQDGKIVKATLLNGDQAVIDAHNEKLVTGVLGEFGLELKPSRFQVRTFRMRKSLGDAWATG